MTNFNKCEIFGIKHNEIDTLDLVYIIYTTKNKEGHTIVNLTLILKVNCQGHVINFGLFEITDLELVRIAHQDQICIMYTTKDNKGHIKVSLTLTIKVKC